MACHLLKNYARIVIWLAAAALFISTIYAFKANSSDYSTSFDITSGGSWPVSSPNYNSTASIASIGGLTNSTDYIISFGFISAMGDIIGPEFENAAINTSTIRVNDSAKFNATCWDGSLIHGFMFSHNNSRQWVNESYVLASGARVEVNFTLKITLIQNDTLGWRFICNDTLGNIGFMGTRVFDINNTIPNIPAIVYPANNTYLSRVDINFSSHDADGDAINFTVFINNIFNISSQSNLTNISIGDGVYNVSISAYDGMGYSGNSSIIIIKDNSPPDITLVTPTNKSGDNDGNIVFEYLVSDASNITNCSLYINNILNLTNSTITKNVYQNFTATNLKVGSYNWSVGCVDITNNNAIAGNRVFAVIKTTTFDGQTTDFSTVNVFALPNLILEKPSFAKISLIETADLSAGADFDSYINISFNRIPINSSFLPPLNYSAEISLYNLTFSNPYAVKDGSSCSECAKKSYVSNTFIFNVTDLAGYGAETAVYSSAETAVAAAAAAAGGGGGGGGGGGAISPQRLKDIKYDFRLSQQEIKAKLKIGKDTQKSLEIRNLGTEKLTFNIDVEDVKDFVSLSDYSFELEIGERKTITVNIVGKKFGSFIGKLIAAVSNISKSIPLIIEVESETALFDIKLDIPSAFKKIAVGDSLKAQITMFNVLGTKTDVVVDYIIKDSKGDVILEESEKFAVEKQSSYVKVFNLPPTIKPGEYFSIIEVRYANSFAVSSQMFEVITKEELLTLRKEEAKARVLSIFTIVVIASLAYVYVLTRVIKKIKKG